MQPLTFNFAWLAVLAMGLSGGAALADDAPNKAVTFAAEQYQQLDRDAQQEFLRSWLVDRFQVAARIALPTEEREQQTARYAEVLAKVAAGQALPEQGVTKLIAKIATVEREAIDQLSLRYRVRVYERYRTDRTGYDRRMEIWRKVIAKWERSVASAYKADVLIAWLSKSLDRMRYDENSVLAELPTFDASDTPLTKKPAIEVPPRSIQQPPIGLDGSLPSPPLARTDNVTRPTQPLDTHPSGQPRWPGRADLPRSIVSKIEPVISLPSAPSSDSEAAGRTAEPLVRVDLYELTARIISYNAAASTLYGQLQVDDTPTVDQLATLLDELADLAERREQLNVYRNLISRDEQRSAGELTSLDAAVALLGAKIFFMREQLSDDPDLPTSKAATRLNELSQQLAELAAKRVR